MGIGLLVLVWLAGRDLPGVDQSLPPALWPHPQDYTQMWWAEGFPGTVPSAPWLRCIQTGRYAMVLDTRTMRIAHLGVVPDGDDYLTSAVRDNRAWQGLPAADLTLELSVAGKTYRCTAGGAWTQHSGPRLIASGRFLQHADVTDLVFTAADGSTLNVEARCETIAWPDRLGFVLAARPGVKPIIAGEASFGRVGGGFGLDGTNHVEVPHRPELDPARFTVELWAFIPDDYQATRSSPWLLCKNQHEQAEGNFGLVIQREKVQARLNIGGGRDHQVLVESTQSVAINAWNHLAMSYDGDSLRLFLNGKAAGEQRVGRPRIPGTGGLAYGRRQDNSGDGYHLRGVVDEIRLYDRALSADEIRARQQDPTVELAGAPAVGRWSFAADGQAALTRPSESWNDATLSISLTSAQGRAQQQWRQSPGTTWQSPTWRQVVLTCDPLTTSAVTAPDPLRVEARDLANGAERPVSFDATYGAFRVDLDGVRPIAPATRSERDGLERVRLTLSNPTDREQTARLLFTKERGGFSITGMSAMLRDAAGEPTGIPVQLSKNWHRRPAGDSHEGPWFRGASLVHVPPRATIPLELTIAYAHWGGVAAASHAQLSLIGWGSNQLWDQSAIGSWGESMCFEPDRAQARCLVTDVRPLMVRAMGNGEQWNWTHNVGGGDAVRLFDRAGRWVAPTRMRTVYQQQGPCLTAVTYTGRCGDGLEHATTVSLGRSGDLVRGTYRLRIDVSKAIDFSRFVIFQIGADTYNYTSERQMALGNESGLVSEWRTQWGGDTYRTPPTLCAGRIPWISLHDAVPRTDASKPHDGAWANRGLVIRAWKARLGGKDAGPWMAERGTQVHGTSTSIIDLIPPPTVTRLEPGDFVDATIEYLVLPMAAGDYYGPDDALRSALATMGNSWRLVEREAVGNDRQVTVERGTLLSRHPAVTVRAEGGAASWTMSGGLGHVPLTISGLASHQGWRLFCDGQAIDQAVHGQDFWQTDYDASTRTWSLTWTVPVDPGPHRFHVERTP
jgi:Concanavalin A-like lectin/glucanases superfamily